MAKRKEIHSRVLNASSIEDLMAAYTEWADEYDYDLMHEMGYVGPIITAELLKQYEANSDAYILDAGCGTGLVGESLQQLGFTDIDGLDYSGAMLKKAQEKEVYKHLLRDDLTGSLDIPNDQYDAVISVGAFTCGHVGPEALNELIRITKPGGYICFVVREEAWQEDNYRIKLDTLEKKGLWTLTVENPFVCLQKEGSRCRVCLYQISA